MSVRRVAVTGASGLIGSSVVAALRARGDQVVRLVRRAARATDEAAWSTERGLAEPAALHGIDAVVHLAGESIANGRWTASRRRRLRDSRVTATERLTQGLAALDRRPEALVMASAIGIYGDRGDEQLTESSRLGSGFLAGLARDWEAAAAPAREHGIRVVPLRFGLVLSRRGGLLERMLPLFRLGLGGHIGRAGAWWSWVALDDVVGLALHALDRPGLDTACNVVAPTPVTSADFARALGEALRRPSWLHVPALALRLRFGAMADEMLLASLRVSPCRAIESGYTFRFPMLDTALGALLS